MMNNPLEKHLTQLKADFDKVFFDAFVDPCIIKQEEDRYLILAPNNATEAWLKKHLAVPLAALLAQDADTRSIDFALIPPDDVAAAAEAAPHATIAAATTKTPGSTPPTAPRQHKTGLLDRFTFDSFITGKANEAALSIAHHIAQGYSTTALPSPFFLYGSTGLGKTHLAHAIGHEYLHHYPNRRIFLTTAQGYMEDVVRAYRTNQVESFKARYQHLDLLIIDDIQYLGGDKTRTQEEFFLLFNRLCENDKPIIVTCDRPPAKIDKIPPRLISRLNAGPSVYITPPEFELRVEILSYNAKKFNKTLPTDVLHFIAEHIKSNVRELEGALLRVILHADFQKAPITIPLCQRVLADLINKTNDTAYPDIIKEKTAEHFHIRASDLSSKSRQQRIVLPRHVAIHLCRQMTNLSFPEIARHFKRSHTTIIHSCQLVEAKIAQDAEFKEDLKYLEMSIKDTLA